MTNELKVISVNVGKPRQVKWKGRLVSTGIFKEPVAGQVALRALNFDGDQQADLTVHGGPDKAVYVYPSEHYEFWRQELNEPDLSWGMFGENLTTQGLKEVDINIGDRFKIGTAQVVVTQPRVPCYKLNLKFGRDDMVKRFGKQGYSGFYVFVLQEGEVGAGDPIVRLSQDENNVKVTDINRIFMGERDDWETMQRAVQVPALAEVWKSFFEDELAKAAKRPSA